jgi:hypothetical protein
MRFLNRRLIFCILLLFISSCYPWSENTRKLSIEIAEQEKIRTPPIKICDIDKSSKNIKATISIKHSNIQTIKLTQKVEKLEIISCFSQPNPKKVFGGRTPWGTSLFYNFTHFYGLANGYPEDEYSLKSEAEKNCEIVLSDYRSKYKSRRLPIPVSCDVAKCQVCEY